MSRLGIIVALPAEAKSLYSKKLKVALPIEIQKDIFLCLSGIGYDAAQTAAKKLLALKVDALISWGVAGAIDSTVNSGDLILAKSIINQDKQCLISPEWRERILSYLQKSSSRVLTGNIASSKTICATIADKNNLVTATGALGVDMESAAIVETALAHQLDCLVIRAVADNANTAIPKAVLEHTDNMGKPRIVRFVWSCLLKPSQIRELFNLARAYQISLKSLSNIASDLKNKHFFYSDV